MSPCKRGTIVLAGPFSGSRFVLARLGSKVRPLKGWYLQPSYISYFIDAYMQLKQKQSSRSFPVEIGSFVTWLLIIGSFQFCGGKRQAVLALVHL